MPGTMETRGTAVRNGSIVLLARIVDGAGRTIRPADAATIEYSMCDVDANRLGDAADAAAQPAVALEIGDVLFNSLQTGGLWTVDDVGYNFRHEITLSEYAIAPAIGGRYEVRYVLTPVTGEETIVKFQLTVAGNR